jgi:predicted heme/steroid binding protein
MPAPTLQQTSYIGTTNDSTPSLTFTSDQSGTITSSLSFSSTTSAVNGTNTITFDSLSDRTYSGETVTVINSNSETSSFTITDFTIDTSSPSSFTTGSISTTGGTIVNNYWNSSNTGITVNVPIANDTSLTNGTIQLQVKVNVGEYQNLGTTVNISAINSTQSIAISATTLESITDFGESVTLTFRAVLNDEAGNSTIGIASSTTLTVDQTAPNAAITYSPSGPYKQGDSVTISATFNESMKDSPVPQISITGSGIESVGTSDMTKTSDTVYTYSYTVPSGNGTGTISLSSGQDLAGNTITSTPTSGSSFTVDNTAPTAAITYSPSGPYKQGDSVTITATFNESMKDSPVPQISITGSGIESVGASDMTKTSDTVYTYSYSVPSGDGTGSISLSSGQDLAGNTITSTPTSGSSFTVDNTAPNAAITYSPSGPYKQGDYVTISATFNESMKDSPVPQISITGSGIENMGASDMTKTSDTVYTYSYSVPSGDGTGTISLSTGQDLAGNTITSTPTSGSSFTVDNTAPSAFTVGSVSTTGGIVVSNYWNSTNTGLTIDIPVANDSSLNNGSVQLEVKVNSGAYQNLGSLNTINSINTTKSISISAATLESITGFGEGVILTFRAVLYDEAGNSTTGTASSTTLTIDQIAPTAAITYSPSGPYKQGDLVTISATFNESMKDYPVPQISITGSGIESVGASDMSKTSDTVYTYSYTVPSGDGTGTISISSGQDLAGNTITSSPTSGSSFTVDNTAPTAAITYSPSGPYKQGDSVTISATFNESMKDSPVPQISITGSGIESVGASDMSKTSATVYTYSYSVPSGDGTGTISLSSGQDLAGNTITSTPTSGSSFTVDNTPPSAFTVGSVSTTGGTVVSNYWNSTNTGLTVDVPIGNDSSLNNGSVQLEVKVNSDAYQNLGSLNTITSINTTKSISISAATLESITGFGEGVILTFRAVLYDEAGNSTTGTESSTTLTIDQIAPTVAITYSPLGPYKQGDSVTITATFNESMKDSPVPQISITGSGIASVGASDMTKTSDTVYTYSYTVPSGDGTGTIRLSSGQDLAGNTITSTPTSGSSFTVDNTAPTAAITYSPSGPYKQGDSVTITTTFSESMKDSPVPQISITGSGIESVGASDMTKTSATVYTYSYSVPSGDGTGTISLSSGQDLAGNTITSTPTSGSSFTVDNTPPSAFTVGSVSTTGGTVVSNYWNSTNTGLTVGVPIANDSSLNNGSVQLEVKVNSDAYQNLGSLNTITSINTTKSISISAATLESITGFGEGVILTFRAVLYDEAGNSTTGTASSTTLTIDQIAPSAFTVGSVSTTGGTVVSNYWNSTNTGLTIDVPIANDSSLNNGSVQLEVKVNSDAYQNLGSLNTITSINTTKSISISAATLESITSFAEGVNLTFRARIKDSAGNSTIGSASSTSLMVDQTAPSITSFTMSDYALKIGDTSTVSIRFSEAVTNFSNSNVTVPNGTLSTLSSSDSGVNWTATYTPDNGVEDNTNLLTIDNTYTDLAGNIGSGGSTNNFTIDTNAPSITIQLSNLPWGSNLNNTEASTNQTVSATTSGAEDGQTVTFTLNGRTYTGTVSSNSASASIPSSDLQSLTDGASYDIKADVDDAAGNSATQSSINFTVDFSNPTLSLLTSFPLNSSKNISISTKFILTFTENIYAGSSGTITIKKYSDDSTVQTIDINTHSSNFTGFGSTKIKISLNSDLSYTTQYYLLISNTIFKDINGNYYAGISNKSTLFFTTVREGSSGSRVQRVITTSNEIIDQFTSNSNTTQFALGLNDSNDKFTLAASAELNSDNLLTISESGNMIVTGDITCNEMSVSSDIRIKENIVNLENILPKINKLRGVYYNLKSDVHKEKHIGFIAQEIEKYFPELVNFNDNLGVKTVNYAQFNSVLLEGLKEMHIIVNDLSNKVKSLQEELAILQDQKNK